MIKNYSFYSVLILFIIVWGFVSLHSTELPEADTIVEKNQQDISDDKLYIQYSKWKTAVSSCDALERIAIEKGYNTIKSEVALRTNIYNKAFPGVPLYSRIIKNEIIIEKYIMNELGITPSSAQINECYNNFLAESPLSSPPAQNIIYPIIQSLSLFSMDTISQLCKIVQEEQNRERSEKDKKHMENWPKKDMAISSDQNLCLVTNKISNECLVTVHAFNSFVSLNQVQHIIQLDSARSIALRKLLIEVYTANKTVTENISYSEDFLEQQEKKLEWKYLVRNLKGNSPTDHELEYIYKKYYDRFFRPKKIKITAIIGSTDSLYVDSLYQCIRTIDADTLSNRLARKKELFKAIPWVVSSSESLPESIVAIIDTMRIGHVCIAVTPFGYFLCRVVTEKRLHEISLNQARGKLLYLYNEENALSKGKPDSVRAIEYYRDNGDAFLTPDTLQCRTWLVPPFDSTVFAKSDKSTQDRQIYSDTSTFQSKIISSDYLPDEISLALKKYFKSSEKRSELIGPLHSSLGVWYFSVKKVNVGGVKIPFSDAEETILRKLEIQHFPFDTVFNTPEGVKLKKQMVLSHAYRNNLNRKIENTTDKEIENMIKDKTLKIDDKKSSNPNKRKFGAARQQLFFQLVKKDNEEMNKWMATLSIDRELLFTGIDSK